MNASQKKKPSLFAFMIVFIAILVAVFICSNMFYVDGPEEKRNKQIIDAAIIALEQYAAGEDYPSDYKQWVSRDNPDGTITAGTQGEAGNVFVMSVERDQKIIPYFVKVGSTTYLNNSHLYVSSAQQSPPPVSQSLPQDEPEWMDEVKACFTDYFPEDNVRLRQNGKKLEVSVYSDDLTAEVTAAQEAGTTPEGWSDKIAAWEQAMIAAKKITEANGGGDLILYINDDADGTTIYATFVNERNMGNMFDTSEYKGNNPPTMSLAEYNAIQTGMTYQEVFDIVGSRGEELSSVDIGDDTYYTVMFAWEGEGSVGANANVTFQGGGVISKAQFGLE